MGQCIGRELLGRWELRASAARVANGSARHETSVRQEPAPVIPKGPDFGLGEEFHPIEQLGEGGSGETWLMIEKHSGRQMALKMIQRPIPKVLHEMLLHEIQVRLAEVDSLPCGRRRLDRHAGLSFF